MTRDTFDMFADPQRGRFGDNEMARSNKGPRVTGSSDLIDLDLIHHVDADTEKAIKVSFGDLKRAAWLPRSLIEIKQTGDVKRVYKGRFDQPVRVTMPEWLAKEKGLA